MILPYMERDGGRTPEEKIRFAAAAVLSALVSALVAVLFSHSVDVLARLPQEHPWLLAFLPLAAGLSYGTYRLLGLPYKITTASTVRRIRQGKDVSCAVAPAVFAGTCLTITAGGAVGKEAGALQMGAALSNALGFQSGLGAHERRALARCGVAAAFAALMGAPVAAAALAYEMARRKLVDVGAAALVGLSAGIGYAVGCAAGMHDVLAPVVDASCGADAMADPRWLLVVVAGAACGWLFAWELGALRELAGKAPHPVIPVLYGWVVAVAAVLAVGTGTACGTGQLQLEAALAGEGGLVELLARLVVPIALLGCGYKGGEVMPVIAVGTLAGCCAATAMGMDAGFGAAIGLAACFAAATDCPVAAAALACEVAGAGGIAWFSVAAALSYTATSGTSVFGNTAGLRDAWTWELGFGGGGDGSDVDAGADADAGCGSGAVSYDGEDGVP